MSLFFQKIRAIFEKIWDVFEKARDFFGEIWEFFEGMNQFFGEEVDFWRRNGFGDSGVTVM